MGRAKPEVTPSSIYGNDEGNYIYIDGYTASNFPIFWDKQVVAWGGNDFIVFDAYIDWMPYFVPNGPKTIQFDGGSGNDTVSLAPTDYSVTANLSTGQGTVHMPNYVFWENGSLHSHPTSIPMEFISIENFFGGTQADEITGSALDNLLNGGAGDDNIWGMDGNDLLQGADGDDYIYGGQGNDLIHGGDGWDHLHGQEGNDNISGGDGNDLVSGGAGNDILNGGAGNNTINGGAGLDFVKYTTAHDVVVDLLNGASTSALGNDQLIGIENVHTGGGDDVVYGDAGINTIWLGDGDDWAFGFKGNDTIKGHGGDDRLLGESGNDGLWGGNGADMLWGGHGWDSLRGGNGDDELFGGTGDDLLKGEHGDDRIEGEDGNDELIGGNGNDTIIGGEGDDTIDAGGHDDLIYVTDGLDVITTGTGSDTLYFQRDQNILDIVTDFDVNADYFAFEEGMFADVTSISLYELAAIDDAFGNATLFMRDADSVWRPILHMYDTEAHDINQRIQDGTIVDLPPLPDTEGGFQFEKEVPVAPDFGDFIMM